MVKYVLLTFVGLRYVRISPHLPMGDYLLLHPEAELSDAEKKALLAGLQATLANDPPVERERTARREKTHLRCSSTEQPGIGSRGVRTPTCASYRHDACLLLYF
jgi:hypothetical protein